jgi:hypothetical protein
MDLQNEIKDINSRVGNDVENIMNQANYYTQILRKKVHVLSVLNTAKLIDELQKNGFFQNSGIWYVNFNSDMKARFYGINEDFISPDRNRELNRLFENVLTKNACYEYSNNENFVLMNFIDLNKPIKEQVIKQLLSPELEKMVEYNEMQIELECNNLLENKRMKL